MNTLQVHLVFYVDFCDLDKLEELNLEYSLNIENEFFKSIGALTSVKFLHMRGCWINGTLPNAGIMLFLLYFI